MSGENQGSGGRKRAIRISNSFGEDEIEVMDFILMTLLRGGDPCMAKRAKAFTTLCRRVKSMKAKVAEIKGEPVSPLDTGSDDGSAVVARASIEPPADDAAGSGVDAE